jgi:O-antigen ligase
MIGVHQAYAPLECVRPRGGTEILVPEGIPCETAERCHEALGGPTYFCERVGLFGTTSIAGRIRFRGIMQDPNELALVTAMAIPLAFAFVELRRSGPRLLLAALTLGAGALCIVHTRSRSGQLALLAALGVYFLRRWRWRGAALASALAVPVLLLGGRSGSEADESTELRLGYWSAAIEMARASPVFGVGRTQFVEHQPQTAHSSVMLALAEVGLPGLFLWTATIYITLKGLLRVLTLAEARGAEARVARTWATALLASLCAFLASALFLSLSDHYVLWIYLGLAGAVVTATRHHEPAFRLDVSLRDLGVVAAIDTALVIGIHLYVRARGF